jgi:hypothetical protein
MVLLTGNKAISDFFEVFSRGIVKILPVLGRSCGALFEDAGSR